jgi:hypothetical protein
VLTILYLQGLICSFKHGFHVSSTNKVTLVASGWTFGQIDGFSIALKKMASKMRTLALKRDESDDPVLAALKRKVLRPPTRTCQ